jgi:hypothetical protein
MRHLALALLLPWLAGCNLFEPGICLTYAQAAVVVSVEDSVTADAVLADSVMARVTEGTYADSVWVSSEEALAGISLAFERAGIYELTVVADGYEEWRDDELRVRAGECHVRQVEVTARLERS